MIIIVDECNRVVSLKTALSHRFAMKDLGVLRNFLGIEVASSSKGYLLSQSKYIAYLFNRARLIENKIVSTPFKTSVQYSSLYGVPLIDSTLYRTIVGNPVYLSATCPDIAQVVHVVSQFCFSSDNSSLECYSSYFQVSLGHSVSVSFAFFYVIFRLSCLL